MASPQYGEKPTFGPPRPRPTVLLLSLEKMYFEYTYGSLLSALTISPDVAEVTTNSEATARLTSFTVPPPTAILATDASLAAPGSRFGSTTAAVARYVQYGGTLVFMGQYSSFARPHHFKTFFGIFGLPWEFGDYYHRTTFSTNARFPPLQHEQPGIIVQPEGSTSCQSGCR